MTYAAPEDDPEEERMLKFGTGKIIVPDDQNDTPIQVLASAGLTEENQAAILAEGETSEEE
jgi:hypothetical protein